MSGHSHWAGIKYKKAAKDAKRGKVWSKLARLLIVAAKAGGGDPSQNLTLRYAIDKAKAANMPKDTIEKAIKRGTGELGAQNFEEVLYEGYGPAGVAIMVEALTDNHNRTTPEIKRLFEKHGGSLGASGCVGWMFSQKGLITVRTADASEDELMEIALAAGAERQINTTKTPRTQPVAQVSSEPPGQLAVPEAPPVSHSVEVYLPIILKGQRGGGVQVSTGQPSDVYLPIILK